MAQSAAAAFNPAKRLMEQIVERERTYENLLLLAEMQSVPRAYPGCEW